MYGIDLKRAALLTNLLLKYRTGYLTLLHLFNLLLILSNLFAGLRLIKKCNRQSAVNPNRLYDF